MRFESWDIKGFDRQAAVDLCRYGINPLSAVFMSSRGITSVEAADWFLKDDASALYSPFLLKDMDEAVTRIQKAMEAGENIAIYGDYDVDGMTATALLVKFFRSKGVDPEIYIPGRMDEGYGLNRFALDFLSAKGISLIITVDCGITGIAEAEYAKELGVELIITDHHECKDEIPSAVAVINPKRCDCRYPNKTLAGVGVAFKLVCAIEKEAQLEMLLDTYSDFVAIGTISDVMPVVGENRALIRHGLKILNSCPRPGLRQLMNEAVSERKTISSAAIAFVLAPRLNAAGRMGRTSLSVELLLTNDDDEALTLTRELCILNDERRQIESGIFEEAAQMVKKITAKGPIVLAKRGWFQGVMGIIAARIAEQNLFPAILISIDENGIGKGSCRSFASFRLHSALIQCDDLLENYGGHEMAAGLMIKEENIEEFTKRINEYYHENIKIFPVPTLRVDFEVEKPALLMLENIESLVSLEPFGNRNPPPMLCMKNAALVSARSVGDGKHARLKVEKSGAVFDCIFFAHAAEELEASPGDSVDIAFVPVVNEFRGKRSVQLQVADVKKASGEYQTDKD